MGSGTDRSSSEKTGGNEKRDIYIEYLNVGREFRHVSTVGFSLGSE